MENKKKPSPPPRHKGDQRLKNLLQIISISNKTKKNQNIDLLNQQHHCLQSSSFLLPEQEICYRTKKLHPIEPDEQLLQPLFAFLASSWSLLLRKDDQKFLLTQESLQAPSWPTPAWPPREESRAPSSWSALLNGQKHRFHRSFSESLRDFNKQIWNHFLFLFLHLTEWTLFFSSCSLAAANSAAFCSSFCFFFFASETKKIF